MTDNRIADLIRELEIMRDAVAKNGRDPSGPVIEIGYPTAIALLEALTCR